MSIARTVRLHPGNLHRYWDVEFVERLGTDPHQVAASLIGQISETQRQEWSGGNPAGQPLYRTGGDADGHRIGSRRARNRSQIIGRNDRQAVNPLNFGEWPACPHRRAHRPSCATGTRLRAA
jgi:hypothetical protein